MKKKIKEFLVFLADYWDDKDYLVVNRLMIVTMAATVFLCIGATLYGLISWIYIHPSSFVITLLVTSICFGILYFLIFIGRKMRDS